MNISFQTYTTIKRALLYILPAQPESYQEQHVNTLMIPNAQRLAHLFGQASHVTASQGARHYAA